MPSLQWVHWIICVWTCVPILNFSKTISNMSKFTPVFVPLLSLMLFVIIFECKIIAPHVVCVFFCFLFYGLFDLIVFGVFRLNVDQMKRTTRQEQRFKQHVPVCISHAVSIIYRLAIATKVMLVEHPINHALLSNRKNVKMKLCPKLHWTVMQGGPHKAFDHLITIEGNKKISTNKKK